MNKELEQGPVVLVVVEDRRKAVVEGGLYRLLAGFVRAMKHL